MRARYPTALELVYDNYNALAIGFCPTERPSGGKDASPEETLRAQREGIVPEACADPFDEAHDVGAPGRDVVLDAHGLDAPGSPEGSGNEEHREDERECQKAEWKGELQRNERCAGLRNIQRLQGQRSAVYTPSASNLPRDAAVVPESWNVTDIASMLVIATLPSRKLPPEPEQLGLLLGSVSEKEALSSDCESERVPGN